MVTEPWVGIQEVAAHLGVTPTSIYRWVERRGLPARRVGRLFRFRLSDVDAWVLGQPGEGVPIATRMASERPLHPEVRRMVRQIVERFRPERVILFGSHAEGTAGPDSDVDLLVVLNVKGSTREAATEIDLALSDRALPLDLLVVTPADCRRAREGDGSILGTALGEGRAVYDPAA